jgi:hypothetical protein
MSMQTNLQGRYQSKCWSVAMSFSVPDVTAAMPYATRDRAKRNVKRGVAMIRTRVLKLASVLTLVFGLQFVYGLQSYAQQPDLDAASAAKAAAGQAALSHRALDAASSVGTAVGTFITFDAPGAVHGTVPYSINATGAVTGAYTDASSLTHGFLRDINGAYSTFDIPGDVYGTVTPLSINSAKAITGVYFDANFLVHGFLRASDGTLTTLDAPGAGTGTFPGGGTMAEAIDTEGVITGIYFDAYRANQGFLRAGDGTFTTFDAPGYIDPFFLFSGPIPAVLSVNTKGVIAGSYWQPIAGNPFGGNYEVFVRALNGTFTIFAAATYSPCCIWSYPSGISPAGTITGVFNDGFDLNHGFVRTSAGSIGTFNAPGAGTGLFQGTVPLGIDATGEIMGYYTDPIGVNHGFLFTLRP